MIDDIELLFGRILYMRKFLWIFTKETTWLLESHMNNESGLFLSGLRDMDSASRKGRLAGNSRKDPTSNSLTWRLPAKRIFLGESIDVASQ